MVRGAHPPVWLLRGGCAGGLLRIEGAVSRRCRQGTAPAGGRPRMSINTLPGRGGGNGGAPRPTWHNAGEMNRVWGLDATTLTVGEWSILYRLPLTTGGP